MIKCVLAFLAAVLLLVGCGGPKPGVPPAPTPKEPAPSEVKIEGDPSTPVNTLAISAIADLQNFWGEQFPKLYDKDFKPVGGGLYALTPDSESGPECASNYGDAAGNAFYCKLDDSVAWDAS